MVEQLGTDIAVEYICNQDPLVNDAIMAGLPEDSIVINATGMGKDTPGSPITDAGLFPAATASPGSSTTAASWILCTRRWRRWNPRC